METAELVLRFPIELGSFAHPYRTLQSGAHVVDEIRAIVEREQISGIVIGLPKNMDGTLGPIRREGEVSLANSSPRSSQR